LTDGWQAMRLTEALAGLNPAEEERVQAREVVLGFLTRATDSGPAAGLGGCAA